MTGWLSAQGPAGTALALLVLGHVLADFVFQTDELAARKHRLGPLLVHVAIVAVVHALAFLPVLSVGTAGILAVVVVGHFVVDAFTARVRRGDADSARRFLGDQFAHLALVVAGWALLAPSTWSVTPLASVVGGVGDVPWTVLTAGAVYVSAFAFAHEGGNAVVRGVLPDDGPESTGEDLAVGSLIGTLERWLVLLLGIAGRWEAVALVVGAKSIARFRELEKRAFAEYFLVGTLTSVLTAVALVVAVQALV